MKKVPEIKILTKKDFQFNAPLPLNLPVSDKKLEWLLANPRMEEEDAVMAVALLDDKIVGHIDLIPDCINTARGKEKFYWMTLWEMDPEYEHTVVSTYLFYESLRAAGNKVLIRSYAESAEAFYTKQPFNHFYKRTRHTFFFGLNEALIREKIERSRWIAPVLPLSEKVSRKGMNRLNRKKIRKHLKSVQIQQINQLEPQLTEFILNNLVEDFIPKDLDYLNWQLHLPADSSESDIECISFSITDGETLLGFLSLSMKEKETHVKYALSKPEFLVKLATLAIRVTLNLKCTHLYTDNQELARLIHANFYSLYHFTQVKDALYHNSSDALIRTNVLQEQDGHFI